MCVLELLLSLLCLPGEEQQQLLSLLCLSCPCKDFLGFIFPHFQHYTWKLEKADAEGLLLWQSSELKLVSSPGLAVPGLVLLSSVCPLLSGASPI